MNIGVLTAYSRPIGFNHGVLQFCKLAPDFGLNPVLIAITRHPNRENSLVKEARRLGLHVQTLHEDFRYDPRVFLQLVKLIDKFNLQLLDAQTYKPLAISLFACCLRGNIPLVSWTHGFSQENLKIRIFGAVEKHLHRFADKVICVSAPFAEILVNKGIPKNKLAVISNAIDDEEFNFDPVPDELRRQLDLEANQPVVGAIGRLSPEKGHLFLIKAWPEILKKVPSAKLVIVGDGPLRAELETEAVKLGIQASVRFAGFRQDGRRFFSLFDIMVLPSLDEGLPYVLLEAMIKKVPVIATSVGEIPEVLQNGQLGVLVQPADPSAISKHTTCLLLNEAKRKDYAQLARLSVLKLYSHESRIEKIVAVYKDACEQGSS